MSKLSSENVNVRIISGDLLNAGITRLFRAVGLSEEDAGIVAETLVSAHLRGVDTHGIRFLPQYYDRFRNDSLNKTPNVRIVKDTLVSALIDGDNGPGQVVGARSMRIAIEKAKKVGIGFAAAYNTNHFGAAAYYAMMAQKEGFIGISATNAGPSMAPTGGKTKSYGNNPWSFAFPFRENGIPVVIDMATSVVANANINIARRIGEKIPLTWALDEDGQPTDDPQKVWLLQPFGGYKGYALSLVVEMMTSVLNGNSRIAKEAASSAGRKDSSGRTSGHVGNMGQFYAAIDPEIFIPLDSYVNRTERLVQFMKESELIEGVEEVFLPGEKEYRLYCERREKGIPINHAFLDDMNHICAELGIEPV